ncbi:MAG: hypothetical protein ABJM82_18025 [Shimia thalassica]|uniref:hypothetical protein n=1 Tax=Rhodobacterales TaxID=204455 RepID=UPI0032969146
MAAPLDEIEIGLIKKMLDGGWKNAAIQFYFNTPERPVNNGRISEIKGGGRGRGVPAATQYELDEFLDHHPLTIARLGKDEPETPIQEPTATQFAVTEALKLDVSADPLSDDIFGDPSLTEVYLELRIAAHECSAMGHNTLGDIAQRVEAFAAALPEDSRDTTVHRIWMRGNKLRMLLGAHDQVAELPDMHLAKLDVACAEALRAVVQAFNVFAALSPKAAELDQLGLGPANKAAVTVSLEQIEEVIDDAANISTDEALDVLVEGINEAKAADDTAFGERQVALVGRSTSNFFTTAIVTGYRLVRDAIGAGVGAVWTKIKDNAATGVAGAIGAAINAKAPALMEFLSANYAAISSFLVTSHANPAVQQFLEFIVKVLGFA